MASEHNRTEEKKTYTVGEIAEMLGISDKVAYTLVKSGHLHHGALRGGAWKEHRD